MEPEARDGTVVLASTAVVATEASARYAKQLLSHVGRKATVEPLDDVPEGGRLVFAYGVGTVRPDRDRLVLHASAEDFESLARVEDVLGRHLVRFGARQQLAVSWHRDEATAPAVPERDPSDVTGGHPRGGGSVEALHTGDAPSHTGPVPQAVSAGGWIYVSALFGVDPATGVIPADAREEADQLFANLAAILGAAGAALTEVVRVGIVMRDLQGDRPVFNEVWKSRFGEHRPARSAIQSPDFGRSGENPRYMIEVTAYHG